MTTRQRSPKYLWLTVLVSASLLLIAAAAPILMALKISPPPVLEGDVYDYDINATSQYTVFMSDPLIDHVMELYSVPTWGGDPILLTPGMTEWVGVLGFILSPDGTTAVYWTGFGEDEDRPEAIYAVPVAGGSAINLTGDIDAGLYLEGEPGIAISADSQWLFYVLGDGTEEHVLYRVPLDGSAEPSAESPTDADCREVKFAPMPSGHGVVYARTKPLLAGSELVYVDPSGVPLTLVTISGVFGEGRISPDGQWVLYIEDLYFSGSDDLFAVSLDGEAPIPLNDSLVMNGNVVNFQVSDDSQFVVYKADQDVDERFEIYSVNLTTLARHDLIDSMVAGGDVLDYQLVNYLSYAIGVVYRADQLVDEKIDLGSVTINGSAAYHLSPGMPDTGDVTEFEVMPNGTGVILTADYMDELFNLWLTTTTGGEPKPVGTIKEGSSVADWPLTADVVDFKIGPNSSYVIFMANLDEQYVTDIYMAGNIGSGWFYRQKINPPMAYEGNVDSFLITPNSQGLVYRADQDTDGVWELYSAFYRYPQYMPILFK